MSSLFGIVVLLLFIPLQIFLGKKTSMLRLRTALRTDERVRLMNEIIMGIQVIKMYAWEIPFGKMIDYTRKREMKAIRYVNYIRGMFSSFIMFVTRISVFTSLVGYVLLGNFLTAEKAFAVTAYYNILRITMTVFFPLAMAQFAETLVSFQRLQKFMMLEERQLPQDTGKTVNKIMPLGIVSENGKTESLEKPAKSEVGIEMKNLKAKWNLKSSENNLDDVSLSIKPKTLVAIIGTVGSGKSR